MESSLRVEVTEDEEEGDEREVEEADGLCMSYVGRTLNEKLTEGRGRIENTG